MSTAAQQAAPEAKTTILRTKYFIIIVAPGEWGFSWKAPDSNGSLPEVSSAFSFSLLNQPISSPIFTANHRATERLTTDNFSNLSNNSLQSKFAAVQISPCR